MIPKRRFTQLNGATTQKSAFFMLINVDFSSPSTRQFPPQGLRSMESARCVYTIMKAHFFPAIPYIVSWPGLEVGPFPMGSGSRPVSDETQLVSLETSPFATAQTTHASSYFKTN
jgi:hypothetical protein